MDDEATSWEFLVTPLGELVSLLLCAALGLGSVLIFRPESYWSRMMVGATMGLLVWAIKVTAIWWSYRA